ncbi:MAG: hypothetical protein ACXVCY_11805 [Pseudobdellovibrionaceae bacterium]
MKILRAGIALIRFGLLEVAIILTMLSPLRASAMTTEEARSLAENYLKNPGAEIPRGPDLKCALPPIFKYYKFKFDDDSTPPELCHIVSDYANHFKKKILPFWHLKEDFGLLVQPISNIDDFNAAFDSHPALNKMTLSNFHFLYLPGTSVSPQKVVWSHEAGHAAFQEILDEHFYPIARAAFIRRIENQAALQTPDEIKLKTLRAQLEAINHNWSKMNPEEQETAHKQQDALDFRIAALDNTLSARDPSRSLILAAFHEFFADLFAVDLYDDLNVVGKAFDDLGLKNTPSDYRRFNPQSEIVSADTWSYLEPHILLTPARHYFGKNIASKIKNKKEFLTDLAQYFIQVLESPKSSEFLSYEPVIEDVDSAQNSESLATVLSDRQKKSELFSWQRYEQIKNFCDIDFKVCKTEIVEQLKRGQDGIFLTNVSPTIANKNLIEAMESIAKKNKAY